VSTTILSVGSKSYFWNLLVWLSYSFLWNVGNHLQCVTAQKTTVSTSCVVLVWCLQGKKRWYSNSSWRYYRLDCRCGNYFKNRWHCSLHFFLKNKKKISRDVFDATRYQPIGEWFVGVRRVTSCVISRNRCLPNRTEPTSRSDVRFFRENDDVCYLVMTFINTSSQFGVWITRPVRLIQRLVGSCESNWYCLCVQASWAATDQDKSKCLRFKTSCTLTYLSKVRKWAWLREHRHSYQQGLLTHSRNWALLEKLPVAQPLKK
jgi:hypothetical protein